MINKQDIINAHERIAPYIHRTPVFTSAYIDHLTGASFYFKCENFQKVGAFKIRGAMNAALQIDKSLLQNGLLTHSSGNHAQAVAFAAKALGTKAYIVMPSTSPQVKVDAVKNYGAEISFCEPNQVAREAAAEAIRLKTGAVFIHPYDNEHVIAGQASCAKELIEDIRGIDILMCPVGGGGLLSGTGLSKHFFLPEALVYGCEPEGAADAVVSFRSGKVEKAAFVNTIADGLLTTLSERTLSYIQGHVKDMLMVNDAEILAALRIVYERMKIIIEPSCAVPLAAAIKYRDLLKGKRVGIILTGGNVDLGKFGQWFKS
jgi:threonine dehydratase